MIFGAVSSLAAWLNSWALWPNLPIWSYALIAMVDTHITTACVTLYLHRCQTHRSITFNPLVEHFMRFWLWVRTAMPTREWVAVHRCHHAHVDSDKDPHSPIVYGIWRVVVGGTSLYHTAAHNKALIEQFGKGTPNDVIEPAGTDTEWGTIAGESLLTVSGHGPYREQAGIVAAALASTSGTALSTHPRTVAGAIVHAATSRRPRTRYPVGRGAWTILALRRVLPDRAFDTVFWNAYKRFSG